MTLRLAPAGWYVDEEGLASRRRAPRDYTQDAAHLSCSACRFQGWPLCRGCCRPGDGRECPGCRGAVRDRRVSDEAPCERCGGSGWVSRVLAAPSAEWVAGARAAAGVDGEDDERRSA